MRPTLSVARTPTLILATALACLSPAGCKNRDADRGGGSKFCTPFAVIPNTNGSPAAVSALAAIDPAAALDDCLHRWGYTLAASTDGAQVVAQAAMAACSPALARWNQQVLTTAAAGPQGAAAAGAAAPSLITGQPTTPIAEHFTYAQARALFYVVQGRAGKCAPPPAAATSAEGAVR